MVALSSSSSAATVPSMVMIAAGATSATFTVTVGSVSAATSVTITAGYQGSSASASLTVTAPSSGGTLPQFTSISISATISGTAQTSGTRLGIGFFALGGVQQCNVDGGLALGVASEYTFEAAFSGFTTSGLTLTCTGFTPTGSEILDDGNGDIAEFSSASLTVTLNPQVISTSGTVTGSINLVSTIATISGSFSGTYTAQ